MTTDVAERLAINTGDSAVLGRIALIEGVVILLLVSWLGFSTYSRTNETHYIPVGVPGISRAGLVTDDTVAQLVEPILTHFINYSHRTIHRHYGVIENTMHPTVSAHFAAWSGIEQDYVRAAKISSNGSIIEITVLRDNPANDLFTIQAKAEREIMVGSTASEVHAVELSLIIKPQRVGDMLLLYVVGYEIPQHSDARPYQQGSRF